MKIAITGSTGLIGLELVASLGESGSEVMRLVRSRATAGEGDVVWDPAADSLDAASLAGVDGVVHLSGENLSEGRWTPQRKEIMHGSRVRSANLLCETLARLQPPPKALVCAAAIGYYGNRGDELLHEESGPGTGYLADLCRDWEAAAQPALDAGIRVVLLRFGMVLSDKGGALVKMLTPFRMGFGGAIGSGEQFVSWIALDDVVGVIQHALTTETIHGPLNTVAPNPVTNAEFTKCLGRALSRPTIFSMPAFAARLAFGEMADELLLASQRVDCSRLLESGYTFRHARLEDALRHYC